MKKLKRINNNNNNNNNNNKKIMNKYTYKFTYNRDIQSDFKKKFTYTLFLSKKSIDIFQLRKFMNIELVNDILFDIGEFIKESKTNKWVFYFPYEDNDKILHEFRNNLQRDIMFNNEREEEKKEEEILMILLNIYKSINNIYLNKYPNLNHTFYKLINSYKEKETSLTIFPIFYKIFQKINRDIKYENGKIFSILSNIGDNDKVNTIPKLKCLFILVKYIETNILQKKYDIAINICNTLNSNDTFIQLCKLEDTCGYLYSNESKDFLIDIVERGECNFNIVKNKSKIFISKNFVDISLFNNNVIPYLIPKQNNLLTQSKYQKLVNIVHPL